MTDPTHTDRIVRQGKALVRAIEAMGTIEHTGPPADGCLQALPACHREGRAHLGEKILSASEHIREDRAVLWMSEN